MGNKIQREKVAILRVSGLLKGNATFCCSVTINCNALKWPVSHYVLPHKKRPTPLQCGLFSIYFRQSCSSHYLSSCDITDQLKVFRRLLGDFLGKLRIEVSQVF